MSGENRSPENLEAVRQLVVASARQVGKSVILHYVDLEQELRDAVVQDFVQAMDQEILQVIEMYALLDRLVPVHPTEVFPHGKKPFHIR